MVNASGAKGVILQALVMQVDATLLDPSSGLRCDNERPLARTLPLLL